MVFQNPRLFPHFTAEENMRFPLSHCNRKSIVKFDELVDLLDLGSLLKRKLGELSGGEAQRVSLSGELFLASEQLLILDEPLSSLDIVRKRNFWNTSEEFHVFSEFLSSISPTVPTRPKSWKRITFLSMPGKSNLLIRPKKFSRNFRI